MPHVLRRLPLWLTLLSAAAAPAAEGFRVDHTGRLRMLHAGSEFHKITTEITVPALGWKVQKRLGKVERVRLETRGGVRRCRADIPAAGGGAIAVDERFDRWDGAVRLKLRVAVKGDVKAGGVFLFLHVPLETFRGGRCEVDRAEPNTPPAATMPAELPEKHQFLAGRSGGLRFASADRKTRLAVTLDRPLAFTVQDGRKFGGDEYSAFFRLLGDKLEAGDSAEVTVTFRLTVPADDQAAKLTLNAARKRFRLEGFGGNFCFRVESPVTEHNLKHIPMARARVHLDLAQWEPTNDNDSPDEINWAYFEKRDGAGTGTRRNLLLARRLAEMRVRYIASTWRVPEFVTAKPGRHWSVHKRIVPREKWPELLESIGAYLLYARRKYRTEPELFSFNESDIGCFVLMTAEEHRDWIKACGAHLAKLGLKTRMLLGDGTKKGNTAFIEPAAADPEAMKHVGAVAFHTWSKGPEQFRAWRDVARRLKLPLIAAEVGPDASAHKDRSSNLLHYFAAELRMYQELLLHAEAQAILEWEYTGDYGMAAVEKAAGGDEPVRPTPRFWMIRQFAAATPRPAVALETTSDHGKVLFTAFTGVSGKPLVLHVANCGAARKASLSGLPPGIRRFRAVRAGWDEGSKPLPPVEARNGRARLDLARFSLLTLSSE